MDRLGGTFPHTLPIWAHMFVSGGGGGGGATLIRPPQYFGKVACYMDPGMLGHACERIPDYEKNTWFHAVHVQRRFYTSVWALTFDVVSTCNLKTRMAKTLKQQLRHESNFERDLSPGNTALLCGTGRSKDRMPMKVGSGSRDEYTMDV